jgi:hypothetical protein
MIMAIVQMSGNNLQIITGTNGGYGGYGGYGGCCNETVAINGGGCDNGYGYGEYPVVY